MSEEDTTPVETPEVAPEIEATAKEMGWVPKDEFKGDPEKWRPADEFVRRGERMIPIIRAENRKLEAEMKELKDTLREMVGQLTKKERDGYERAMREIQARERAAVETADLAAYEAAQKDKEILQKELGESGKEQPPPPSPDSDPVFQAWSSENGWYNDDVDMTVFANQAGGVIARKMGLPPDKLPPRAFYDAVTEAVKKRYPDRFGNAKRSGPPAVEGVRGIESSKRGKGWMDIPANDRHLAATRLIGKGRIFADRAAYAEAYWQEYGDEA